MLDTWVHKALLCLLLPESSENLVRDSSPIHSTDSYLAPLLLLLQANRDEQVGHLLHFASFPYGMRSHQGSSRPGLRSFRGCLKLWRLASPRPRPVPTG